MENYKTRLQEQAKALQTDIEKMGLEIDTKELLLTEMKKLKSEAVKELRSIEKKLAKL